jgi:hypothetical protein
MSSSWSFTLDQTGRDYGFGFCPNLKAGTIIGQVEGNHESDKQMSVTPDIAFGEASFLEGEAIFPNLHTMVGMVEEIVAMFGPNPSNL